MIQKTTSVCFILVLIITAFLFAPALHGPFVLDDNVHLPKLAALDGSVDSYREVMQLTLNNAGGSGRPLSFLSLLINDNTWPTDTYSFKYTNLLIHLLNAVLVFLLFRLFAGLFIQRAKPFPNTESQNNRLQQSVLFNKDIIALAVMTLWVIHPIHHSTILMVIQRMTLLMGTFTLIGLILYTLGRYKYAQQTAKSYTLMTLGIGLCGLIGVLFKESAIMLVCYVLTLELCISTETLPKNSRTWKTWFAIFIITPLLLLVIYIVFSWPKMSLVYETMREFNVWERLMTEPRVLLTYLRVILFPSLSASGPYHDDFIISRGLFTPITTIVSLLVISALLASAIKLRHKFPVLAFALLWYLLSHSLEASVIPLELYFEHRNYIPMLGLLFAASYYIALYTGKYKQLVRSSFVLFIILEASISYSSSTIWSDNALIANIWAHEHPASKRAQMDAAQFWIKQGRIEKAKQHLKIGLESNPRDVGIATYKFTIDRCNNGNVEMGSSLEELNNAIPTASFNFFSLEIIRYLVKNTRSGKCDKDYDTLLHIIDLFLSNNNYSRQPISRSLLHQEQSKIYLEQGKLHKTITALDIAYEARPDFDIALNQAYLLATAQLFTESAAYIQKSRSTKPNTLYQYFFKDEEISAMETLIDNIAAQANTDSHKLAQPPKDKQ